MNNFVKFLILSTSPNAMLYGFSAPTALPIRKWRTEDADKRLKLVCCSAILSDADKSNMLSQLENQNPYSAGKIQICTKLVLRPKVLSDTDALEWEQNKPVSKLHSVYEYWCVDKDSIIRAIHDAYGKITNMELRQKKLQLFEKLQDGCGIDFSTSGGRLGNFECYTPGKYIDSFDVKSDKGRAIILTKKHDFVEELLVNCAIENGGRWITDETKVFMPNSNELNFSAQESATHYRIRIWDKLSGELVFASESSFIRIIQVSASFVGAKKIIKDPWTDSLRKSTKHTEAINRIGQVNATSSGFNMSVGNDDLTLWEQAKITGQRLLVDYKRTNDKGAFVPKTTNKLGEIDSFSLIRSYIDTHGVERIIIADPYFSVESSGKFLTKIESQSKELIIVTALTDIDPDTGKALDARQACKDFLTNNRNMLHQNMSFINVLRNTKQAFHDRYIIRYFSDGRKDGFLLSNSLNSAGQFYPYVSAPLEYGVLLQVENYLLNLTNEEYQKTLPKNERVSIEILFEPLQEQNKILSEETCVLPKFLTGDENFITAIESCIKLGYFRNDSDVDSFHVAPEKFQEIVMKIFDKWDADPELAITALGEMLYRIVLKKGVHAEDTIRNIPGAVSKYVETATTLCGKMELRQNHGQQPVENQQFTFWAIMNGSATPGAVSHWFDGVHPFWYEADGHWACLYEILFQFDCEKFITTLESIKSPLMLLTLLQSLRYTNFDSSLYCSMLSSKWDWMHDLAAEWLRHLLQSNHFDVDIVFDSLDWEFQLKQSVYLLSRTVFIERVYSNRIIKNIKGESICDRLKKRIISICNGREITDDNKTHSLLKLSDVEETSNAKLLFSIAECVENESVRNDLLGRVIAGFERKRNSRLPFKKECDQAHVDLVVKAMGIRYLCAFEIGINKLLDWNALKNFLEPYLSDRNYEKWSSARSIVIWDIQLIKSLRNSGYSVGDKADEYYNLATLLLVE